MARTRRKRKSRKFDYESAVPEVVRGVVERLGLDYLGLSYDELREVIEPIVVEIVENRKTKPSIESLIKRIINNKQLLFKAIASKLAGKEELTLEQLEFIITNAPELAGRAAPLLYDKARRLQADYLIDSLRYLWQRYGKPTRIRCPYCGFYSVTPDMKCIVCGREVDERDLKQSIGFEKLLREFAEHSDRALVEEVIRAGYVIYDGEIHPPSAAPLHRAGVQLFLSRREKELLRSILEEARDS